MECIQSTFDLFEKPPLDISIASTDYMHVLPLSGMLNENTIDFNIPPQPENYTDLAKSYLHVKIKIERTDDKVIEEDGKIALIPLWPQTLWRQIDMSLGQTLVSTSTNQASYRSWLETVLSFPKSVQTDQLDVLEHLNGYKCKGGSKSEIVEGVCRLNLDLMQQNRLLLNGIPISIRLYRNSDKFMLHLNCKSGEEELYKITLQDIALYVNHVLPKSSILLQHVHSLSEKTAVYPIDRTIVRTAQITKGIQESITPNIFMGQIPHRIVVGLVSSDDYNGNLRTNPFNFKPHSLNHISLTLNGKQIPNHPYDPDFEEGIVRRSYHHLMETLLGNCQDERSIGLSLEEYLSGKTFFGFQLIGESGNNSSAYANEFGNINLRIRFGKPVKENITVILYAEFQNQIEIDASRQVHLDF